MIKKYREYSLSRPKVYSSEAYPLFSESVLRTNFYNELQKNGWCKIIDDKPDSLFEYVKLNTTKKQQ